MPLRDEERKQAVVEHLAGMAAEMVGTAFARLVRSLYAHVPPADLLARDERDLLGAARSLWDFAALRPSGETLLRVLGGDPDAHGWAPPRTMIEIVNDDMPFLVDSVTAALNAMGLTVDLIVHPIVTARRDEQGRLLDLRDDDSAGPTPGELRESLMQVEIVAPLARLRRAAMASRVAGVLADVRHVVADFPAMRRQVEAAMAGLASGPAGMPPSWSGSRRIISSSSAIANIATPADRPRCRSCGRVPDSASCATTAIRCSRVCAISPPCRLTYRNT
jgi:glutamate dehydrogenase